MSKICEIERQLQRRRRAIRADLHPALKRKFGGRTQHDGASASQPVVDQADVDAAKLEERQDTRPAAQRG